MEKNQNENFSNKLNTFVDQFKQEREEWTGLVKSIASKIKDIYKLEEVQIDLFSNRQIAVDYVQDLYILLAKAKMNYEKRWKVEYDKLTMNEDYRYGEREKNRFASEKIAGLKYYIDITQIQIDFFKETIKTIDSMIFGVKHRMEIEDFKRGNK